jgi:hypothetical protein
MTVIGRALRATSVARLEQIVEIARGLYLLGGDLRDDRQQSSGCTGWTIAPNLIMGLDLGDIIDVKAQVGFIDIRRAPEFVPVDALVVGPSHWCLFRSRTSLGTVLRVNAAPAASDILASAANVMLLYHPWGAPLVCSQGHLIDLDEQFLHYDADTEAGASGAPVLDEENRVIALHLGWNPRGDQRLNYGVRMSVILRELREVAPELFNEIVAHQQITTGGQLASIISSYRERHEDRETRRRAYLQAAAVLWSFDPRTIAPVDIAPDESGAMAYLLEDAVSESSQAEALQWTLKSSPRRRALRSLATVDGLQKARAANPNVNAESGSPQGLIDHLIGWKPDPRFSLAALSVEQHGWLRVVITWFEGIVPILPSPADSEREQARKLQCVRFEALGGAHFRGRATELRLLADKLLNAPAPRRPLLIHGPGGTGKSSLVSRFVLDHCGGPAALPFAYVDFDRPSLGPDDPWTILTEIVAQLELQIDGGEQLGLIREILAVGRANDEAAQSSTGEVVKSRWYEPHSAKAYQHWRVQRSDLLRRATAGLAKLLQMHASGKSIFLLIFDSFEEAQYSTQLQLRVLDELLGLLIRAWPQTSVIALGRASSAALILGGLPVENVQLRALDDAAADAYVQGLGIADPSLRAGLVEAARGNPLMLQVGARYLRDSNDMDGLRGELCEAVLYGRILEHIHDEEIAKLAHPGLVLRRVTPAGIQHVLAPAAGFEELSAKRARELFDRMRQEVFLIQAGEDDDVLTHRPELRHVMLPLLEQDRPDEVHAVDAAAVEFWSTQRGEQARAEELYHRLRLGEDESVLDRLWSPSLLPYLGADVRDELPASARAWLDDKLQDMHASASAANLPRLLIERHLIERHAHQAAARRDAGAVLELVDGQVPDHRMHYVVAVAQLELGDLDEARQSAEQAELQAEAAGDVQALFNVHVLLAEIADLVGDKRLAESRLNQAEEFVVRSLDPLASIAVFAQRAVLRYELGLRDEAFLRAVDRRCQELQGELLARNPMLGRYMGAALSLHSPPALREALQTLGFGDSEQLDEEARALAAAAPDVSRLSFLLSILKVELSQADDPVALWRKILEAARHPDAKRALTILADEHLPTARAIAAIWIARLRASIYEELRGGLVKGTETKLLGNSEIDSVLHIVSNKQQGDFYIQLRGALQSSIDIALPRLRVQDPVAQARADLQTLNRMSSAKHGLVPWLEAVQSAVDQGPERRILAGVLSSLKEED